jgi:hypothetical protein
MYYGQEYTIYFKVREPEQLSRYSDELDDRCSITGRGKKFVFSSRRPDRLWGPYRLLIPLGTGSVSPGVKWP